MDYLTALADRLRRRRDDPDTEAINAVLDPGQPCTRCGGSGQVDNRGRPYPPEIAATFGNDGGSCPACGGTGMTKGGKDES